MRHMTLTSSIAVIALCATAIADDPVYEVPLADEQGEGFVPYSATPDHPSIPNLYADDFTLDATVLVERIGWFGYSDFWDNPDLTNFTKWEVRIYEGQGQGEIPGDLVYQQTFDKAETSPDPLSNDGLFGAIMYRHEVELDEPVELEGGSQYWIGIGADAIGGASDWWIWAQAPPADETIARWHWENEEWTIQPPDFDPDWPTYNTAFQIIGEEEVCPPADLNCDGVVDGADLLILLSEWGPCNDPDDCPADLNGDGQVDGADLLILLSQWG